MSKEKSDQYQPFEPLRKLLKLQKKPSLAEVLAEAAPEPKRVWKALTKVQRYVCIQFFVPDWQTGVERSYLDMALPDIHASWSDVETLVQAGVIEAQPIAVFSQRWLDENKAKIAEHQTQVSTHSRPFSKQERKMSVQIDHHKAMVQQNVPDLHYRLKDKTFRNWIAKKYGGDFSRRQV